LTPLTPTWGTMSLTCNHHLTRLLCVSAYSPFLKTITPFQVSQTASSLLTKTETRWIDGLSNLATKSVAVIFWLYSQLNHLPKNWIIWLASASTWFLSTDLTSTWKSGSNLHPRSRQLWSNSLLLRLITSRKILPCLARAIPDFPPLSVTRSHWAKRKKLVTSVVQELLISPWHQA